MNILNDLSNDKIDKYLKKYQNYGGCFSCLDLPRLQEKVYITNIDIYDQGGTHWTLVSNLEPNRIIYFDPFGLPSNIPINEWMKKSRKPIYFSNVDYQAIKSKACGYFCVYVAKQLCEGRKFNDIIKDFHHNTLQNERKLDNYFLT